MNRFHFIPITFHSENQKAQHAPLNDSPDFNPKEKQPKNVRIVERTFKKDFISMLVSSP
ncbi:hypothetical protein NC99_32170 [Sunxiuqinia dokdonensis]|uniref:Uncharacterized protein n=1 Tax=Sunxiuqinia dokdonensis TaxID=1409788 RepID=A0A0L8V6D5_9BACT|nr:hypothetical protein NC99_32170 [Sunxiuqinia dokdonensis]